MSVPIKIITTILMCRPQRQRKRRAQVRKARREYLIVYRKTSRIRRGRASGHPGRQGKTVARRPRTGIQRADKIGSSTAAAKIKICQKTKNTAVYKHEFPVYSTIREKSEDFKRWYYCFILCRMWIQFLPPPHTHHHHITCSMNKLITI